MSQSVQQARQEAKAAERRQMAAWSRWYADPSAENEAAWTRAVEEQRAAERAVEDAADRWEATEYERESRQSDWWVAAVANARAA